MKKEERIQLRKIINLASNDIKREFHWKKSSYALFAKVDEAFLCCWVSDGSYGNRPPITIIGDAKPYIYDDLFWKAYDMEGNINAPQSLRAIGAFAVSPNLRKEDYIESRIEEWDFDDLYEKLIEKLRDVITRLLSFIEQHPILDYYSSLSIDDCGREGNYYFYRSLYLLFNKDYDALVVLAHNCITSHYVCTYSYYYERLLRYCEKQGGKQKWLFWKKGK